MNPKFNRVYGYESVEGFMTTMFTVPLMRGIEPYYCPTGWRRFAIDVDKSGEEFERAYGDWPVAYHGTADSNSTFILLDGFRASFGRCFDKERKGIVYLSPSIEYSGHPYYAKILPIKGMYIQMVLQVRVEPKLIFNKKPGTLDGAFPGDPPMDPNFEDNNALEWLIQKPPVNTYVKASDGIVVYGIMLRVTKEHPSRLKNCAWWDEEYKK